MIGKISILLVAIAIVLAFGWQFSLAQEQDQLDSAEIISKLDEVLANQEQILEQFEEIKQELAIVKVRCSR